MASVLIVDDDDIASLLQALLESKAYQTLDLPR
jgi:hypothetical protein